MSDSELLAVFGTIGKLRELDVALFSGAAFQGHGSSFSIIVDFRAVAWMRR